MVSSHISTVVAENLIVLEKLGRRAVGIPDLSVTCDGPQRLSFASTPDEDRDVAPHRPRFMTEVLDRVEAAAFSDPITLEQGADQGHRLVEAVEAFTEAGAEVDGIGSVLLLVPTCPDT